MLAQNIASAAAALLGRARPSLRPAARAAALLGLGLLLPLPAAAETPPPYVVGSDRGGYLHDRLIELNNLQRNNIRVEIRGRVCYATCTMFLGLPGACVDPRTTFGFHGPAQSGRLAQQEFDYFSQVMAQYYPKPLQEWFMAEGRKRTTGIYKIKGSQIIRMGVPACSAA